MSEETKKIELGREGLYDARKLGVPKMLVLGVQHTFAMFGATVLVPILTGISVSTALLFAGIGTLLFHLLTKGKVPAFLGSSFAFLGGYAAVAPLGADGTPSEDAAVCGGRHRSIRADLRDPQRSHQSVRRAQDHAVLSAGRHRAHHYFHRPDPCAQCHHELSVQTGFWHLSRCVIVVCNIWGKGMVKILPILIGIVVSYIAALFMGEVDFTAIQQADWFGLAIHTGSMAKFSVSACITIAPIALATMMEHIGDIAAISATCERPYLSDPGLHRTLLGDGLATSLAGFFGAPANTTYGENTGVLALTKVYDPRVMRIAACFAILLSFFPKIGAAIQTVPSAIIGGISFVLYGMISSVGVRNVVENQVDFTKSRNLIIAAVILVSALGFNSVGGITVPLGASYSFTLSGLAIAAIVGILLNAILPGNDYEFGTDLKGDTAVNFEV